jgi:membrane fusion protein, multidrug efflux system
MSATIVERDTAVAPVKGRAGRTGKQVALAALAACLAVGAAWYGHDWWTKGRFIESTDDAYVGGDVTAISPHVAGFVADIAVTDNQYVRAGQLLVKLDSRDYQAALNHAQAVVSGRVATLASLRAQYPLQQSMIRQAQAELTSRVAQAGFAHDDAQRYAILAHTSAGSQQTAERTEAADRQAQAAIQSANAALAAAQQRLDVITAEIQEAQAAVAQAQSDLEIARLNLGYTEIRSPIDGYVGSRAVRVGSYVAGGAYLLSVIPAHGLWVDANFKEDQLARMVSGQSAVVVADVLPGHVLRGHVLSLAPGTGAVFSVIPPENATGNFTKIVQRVPVRIALDADEGTLGILRPGLSTTVSVDTRRGARP